MRVEVCLPSIVMDRPPGALDVMAVTIPIATSQPAAAPVATGNVIIESAHLLNADTAHNRFLGRHSATQSRVSEKANKKNKTKHKLRDAVGNLDQSRRQRSV